jgi:3-dehydroquinate synthase
MALMAQDKKVVDGRLRFILARGIGAAFVADDVPPEAVREVLAEALAA